MVIMLFRLLLALVVIFPQEIETVLTVLVLVLGITMQFFNNPYNSYRENVNDFICLLLILGTYSIQLSIGADSWYNLVIVILVRAANFLFVIVNCFMVVQVYWHEYKKYVFMVRDTFKNKCC